MKWNYDAIEEQFAVKVVAEERNISSAGADFDKNPCSSRSLLVQDVDGIIWELIAVVNQNDDDRVASADHLFDLGEEELEEKYLSEAFDYLDQKAVKSVIGLSVQHSKKEVEKQWWCGIAAIGIENPPHVVEVYNTRNSGTQTISSGLGCQMLCISDPGWFPGRQIAKNNKGYPSAKNKMDVLITDSQRDGEFPC